MQNKSLNDKYCLSRNICIQEDASVREYVLTKKLDRPRTNAFSVIALIVAYAVIAFAIGLIVNVVFDLHRFSALVYVASYIAGFLLIAKPLCILLVKCYQHYAKEATRRKCLCKPTCSEYALAVLKKCWLPIALHKIRIRLFKTCTNGYYKIDLP